MLMLDCFLILDQEGRLARACPTLGMTFISVAGTLLLNTPLFLGTVIVAARNRGTCHCRDT